MSKLILYNNYSCTDKYSIQNWNKSCHCKGLYLVMDAWRESLCKFKLEKSLCEARPGYGLRLQTLWRELGLLPLRSRIANGPLLVTQTQIRRSSSRGRPKGSGKSHAPATEGPLPNENNKRKSTHSPAKSSKRGERRCSKSGCTANVPVCFANATERCVGNGYTSRWYHLSAGEHYCNECFETFYRSYKDGYMEYMQWKTQWSSNGKTEPSLKMFMADRYLPFWVQCTKGACRKWRQQPHEVQLTSDFIKEYVCDGRQAPGNCEEPEDARVAQAQNVHWIETLVLAPMMKSSPSAQFLGAYYPDGVGMSPTCPYCIKANSIFQESKKPKINSEERADLARNNPDDAIPKIPGLNPNFQPFYQPTEQGKALCVRPDVMEYDEEQEFREYSREQIMYLAIRNLIIALWNLDCKKWLMLEDVAANLICRGLVRVRCVQEADRILKFLTKKGIINTGLLKVPREHQLVKSNKGNVVVVGAGAAGLGAARQLCNFGIDVTILEARDRIGGRIWDDRSLGVCVGKGAHIVTGVINNPVTMMCEQAGYSMRYLGVKCELFNHLGQPTDPAMDSKIDMHFNAMLDAVAEWRKDQPRDTSLHDKLWEMHNNFLKESKGSFTEDQMKVFTFHVNNLEYACGSNLKEVSALHWDQNENFAQFAGDHTLLQHGYSKIMEALSDDINMRLGTEVKKIDYCGDTIVISTRAGEKIEASRVLVTVPLAILQDGDVQFNPPFPEHKKKALSGLGAGIIEKVALLFPVRFWDSRLQGADFFGYVPPAETCSGQFAVFCDMNPAPGDQGDRNSNVLMTYLCGNAMKLVNELTDKGIVQECMKVLRGIFTEQDVPEPSRYFVTRWGQDRFSKMAYSYVRTGGSGEAYDILAEDIDQKVFFAGEATNRYFPQTVTGAYLSGVREASKILKSFS